MSTHPTAIETIGSGTDSDSSEFVDASSANDIDIEMPSGTDTDSDSSIEVIDNDSPSPDNPPQRTKSKKRKQRTRAPSVSSSSEASEDYSHRSYHSRRSPSAPATMKLAPYPEFGSYPEADRLREFRDYIEVVDAAMEFAPDWDEDKKASYFRITCGRVLTSIINAHKLRPENSPRPYRELIENIDNHFTSTSDPALDHQAMTNCTQQPGEAARDFFQRLEQLVRHRNIRSQDIRTHFILSLRDQAFSKNAVMQGWTLEQIIAAAARSEAWRPSTALRTGDPGQGEVAAISTMRGARSDSSTGHRFSNPSSAASGGNGRRRCPSCGIMEHRSGSCPAKGKECMNCGGLGHFAIVCDKPQKNQKPRATQRSSGFNRSSGSNRPAGSNRPNYPRSGKKQPDAQVNSIESDWD